MKFVVSNISFHSNKKQILTFLYLQQVPPEIKLPILYLIDSIVKNVKNSYVQLFSQCIVTMFCGVFEKVSVCVCVFDNTVLLLYN